MSLISGWHRAGRVFFVPITTGTSETDAKFSGISSYKVRDVPLPVLNFEHRAQLAKNYLLATGKFEQDKVEMILQDSLFRVALADTGGLPGLVVYTCQYDFDKDTCSVVQHLHHETASYIQKGWDKRMESIFSAYLARRKVFPSMELVKDGNYTVQDALDGGTIFLKEGEIRLAPALVSKFNAENSMINSLLVKAPSKTDKWTWRNFESVHLLYLAAVLAAMIKEKEHFQGATLGTYLRNMKPSDNAYLFKPLHLPLNFTATHYKIDPAQCIPRAIPASVSSVIDVDVMDREHVHQSHTGTPIIDGYVTLDVGYERLTIFLQYKHSDPESSSSKVRVSHMNQEIEKLGASLKRHEKWESDRQWIFVWITNREVESDTLANERLLWVDKDSLSLHCPLIGNRGLVGL
ncbi:unnamed protein product [Cylindrotheca closterium]|uniref:Uncharacterized protein n=1 Tax=Cylindrotheca closterium TaxID=2856 RepID=A0AAD2CM39_9STRA|nr:unnamed protein product [Cylindrotheca closterium]